MRLWHQALIPYLDKKRLLGQHRECCALRGKGWGKKHSVVDQVFKLSEDISKNDANSAKSLQVQNYSYARRHSNGGNKDIDFGFQF